VKLNCRALPIFFEGIAAVSNGARAVHLALACIALQGPAYQSINDILSFARMRINICGGSLLLASENTLSYMPIWVRI
jgi:hypothetical protein